MRTDLPSSPKRHPCIPWAPSNTLLLLLLNLPTFDWDFILEMNLVSPPGLVQRGVWAWEKKAGGLKLRIKCVQPCQDVGDSGPSCKFRRGKCEEPLCMAIWVDNSCAIVNSKNHAVLFHTRLLQTPVNCFSTWLFSIFVFSQVFCFCFCFCVPPPPSRANASDLPWFDPFRGI